MDGATALGTLSLVADLYGQVQYLSQENARLKQLLQEQAETDQPTQES